MRAADLTRDEMDRALARFTAGEEWDAIGPDFGKSGNALRKCVRRGQMAGVIDAQSERARAAAPSAEPRARLLIADDGPTTVGVMADEKPDPEEVWKRAETIWGRKAELRERQASQEIRFSNGPACIVFISDLHLGGSGTNYPRIRRDIEIAREIPNAGVFLVGDLVDNFVIQKLAEARHESRLAISDEWVMAEHVMSMLGPKLVACVAGNHDEWARRLGGVDVLRSLTARVRKGVIYDTDEAIVTIRVGDASWRVRARHKWLGSSIYNAIHGQGRAARWDNNADIYVGGHTHRGALYGTLNVGDRLVHGIQLGAYKEIDAYQRREGFAMAAPDAAMALILTERGRVIPCDSLEEARRVMEGRL